MRTMIVGTLGPASSELRIVRNMVSAGLDVARINTKYVGGGAGEEFVGRARKAGAKILIDIIGLGKAGWAASQKPDFVAVAFSETVSQIKEIKKIVGSKVRIIAKIESRKGVRNVSALLRAADGLMVARGDLGKNVPYVEVPFLQKRLLDKCKVSGKLDITATEMLLSMVSKKIPSRAEVSDVANAVLDGSDGVMLSEETAIGKYPVEAVKVMRAIVNEAEKYKGN